MTQAQKVAKEKFKKAIEYRKKTGVSLKEAFAHVYGKKKTAPKKKVASKKVAAIKIIEKGESKSAKAKATYQQVRTKKGTFKGLKKVGAVSEWGVYVGTNLREKFTDELAAYRYADLIKSTQRLPSTFVKVKKIRKTKKVGAVAKKSAPKKSASKRITDIHKDSKSHNVNIRVVSGLPSYKDPDMARELELYADNDSLLYFQRRKPILINLSKKYKKGTYDIQKAAKLWRYYIDAALEKYNKEFGSRGDKWYDLMSVADRNLLALEYAQNTKDEFDLGNFTEK
jgi:hypothetical protein